MPTTEYINQNMARLAKLDEINVLDSGAEPIYDEITQLTADLCEAPICLISLVDEDRQWFKSEIGLGVLETKLEQSICAHAVRQNEYLEIYDTQLDERTVDNTLCQSDRAVRFYAGAILRTLDGWPLGTLCVLDYEPRELSVLQRRVLHVHAKCVTRQIEYTKAIMDLVGPGDYNTEIITLSDEDIRLHKAIQARFETLSPREEQVVKLIAGHSISLSSKEIAKELGISFRTVHHHRANLMEKMEVDSVAELISVILKAGIYR